jgi:hypothetical protein
MIRDGLQLYRALVAPANFSDPASQRAIKLQIAQIFAAAYNPELPSPFPKRLTYEHLEQWMGQFAVLHRLDNSWRADETALISTLLMLVRRIPSARAIVQVLEQTWLNGDTYPTNLRAASALILKALGPELPHENTLLPTNLASQGESDSQQLHNMGAPERHDSETDEDAELLAMGGRGPPRHGQSQRPRAPGGAPGGRTASRPTGPQTFVKRNPCGSCPAMACGNETSSTNKRLCSAYNPNVDPKAGSTRSQLAFLKDTVRIAALLPNVDISKVSPRAALAQHQPSLKLAADGFDGVDQNEYECFIICGEHDESESNEPAFGAIISDDALAQSLAMLTTGSFNPCGGSSCTHAHGALNMLTAGVDDTHDDAPGPSRFASPAGDTAGQSHVNAPPRFDPSAARPPPRLRQDANYYAARNGSGKGVGKGYGAPPSLGRGRSPTAHGQFDLSAMLAQNGPPIPLDELISSRQGRPQLSIERLVASSSLPPHQALLGAMRPLLHAPSAAPSATAPVKPIHSQLLPLLPSAHRTTAPTAVLDDVNRARAAQLAQVRADLARLHARTQCSSYGFHEYHEESVPPAQSSAPEPPPQNDGRQSPASVASDSIDDQRQEVPPHSEQLPADAGTASDDPKPHTPPTATATTPSSGVSSHGAALEASDASFFASLPTEELARVDSLRAAAWLHGIHGYSALAVRACFTPALLDSVEWDTLAVALPAIIDAHPDCHRAHVSSLVLLKSKLATHGSSECPASFWSQLNASEAPSDEASSVVLDSSDLMKVCADRGLACVFCFLSRFIGPRAAECATIGDLRVMFSSSASLADTLMDHNFRLRDHHVQRIRSLYEDMESEAAPADSLDRVFADGATPFNLP